MATYDVPKLESAKLRAQKAQQEQQLRKSTLFRFFSVFAIAFMFVLTLGQTHAQAAIDLSGYAIDLSPWETLMGVIMTALGALAVGRKLVGSANKF